MGSEKWQWGGSLDFVCLSQSEVKAHRILPGTKEIKDIIAVLTLMGTQNQGQGGGQYGWW
jgi:hypothetical protein